MTDQFQARSPEFTPEADLDPRCFQFRPPSDNTWMLGHCFKIIMMQAGFAVVESSFVRQKNSANIMMKNVVDLCVGSLGYFAFGWALAFGVDPDDHSNVNPFCGTGEWFLIQGYDYGSWMFQLSFAATAATIDSGAVAERMNFKPYVMYSFIMTSFIYPIVCHWVWDENGWLSKMGFHDFAGSGPVHMVGGMSALVSAWFIGPRSGRFADTGELIVTVVQGENLNDVGLEEIHPYVTVKQVNHGNAKKRTRKAESKNPRWGQALTFKVKPDTEEEAKNAELDVDKLWCFVKMVDEAKEVIDDEDEDSPSRHRTVTSILLSSDAQKRSISSDSMRSTPTSPSRARHGRLNACPEDFERGFCRLTQWGLEILADEGGKRLKFVPFRTMDKVERWSNRVDGCSVHLSLSHIDFLAEDPEPFSKFLHNLLFRFKPTISPQILEVTVTCEENKQSLCSSELRIVSSDKPDPEKYTVRKIVKMEGGGNLEILASYTSPQRMEREIFQACDPVKLMFGTFILWINWYSFNVGSTLGSSGGGIELGNRVAVVTTVGTAAGACLSMIYSEIRYSYVMTEPLASGILGALVAICAGCAVITPGEALVVGLVGSAIALAATEWEAYVRIDDPCGAFAIHGAAGVWGIVSVGLFADKEPCTGSFTEQGLLRGGGFKLLGIQLIGAVAITAWSMTCCLICLSTFQKLAQSSHWLHFLAIRPSKAQEELGFDQTEHNIHRPNLKKQSELERMPIVEVSRNGRKTDSGAGRGDQGMLVTLSLGIQDGNDLSPQFPDADGADSAGLN